MNTSNIFDALTVVQYSETQKISELQTSLYKIIELEKTNMDALVMLMQTYIMLGKKEEAKALSYKIWEGKDDISYPLDLLFIDNLINIGLVEMASQILKTIFENLNDFIEDYYPLFIKFATATGNLALLSKTYINLPEDVDSVELCALIDMLNLAKYSEHFKAIAKSILSDIKEKVLALEIYFYDDEDITRWDYNIYIEGDLYDQTELKNKIERNIDAYFETNKPQYRLAPNINILNISEHSALNA